MRDAITGRDALAVLEAITRHRPTFTRSQLHNMLAKEIFSDFVRAQFAREVLRHAACRPLADEPDGPATRYTTRMVLEAERHVLEAAQRLAQDRRHNVSGLRRSAVLGRAAFAGISREQVVALRHVTGAQGLAIIDGQAGTGKSFTIAAAREAYQAEGYRVVGLAPTNAVAQDMRAAGFAHAATIHSELFALDKGLRSWDGKTIAIVDEAAMLDTKLMGSLTDHALGAGAKLILVGDDRQLPSIERGGMFGAFKKLHGAAELTEVRRQNKTDERCASRLMAEGNFQDALGIYQNKGAIHWTDSQDEAQARLIEQWAKDSAARPEKTRFVFAYTNADVAKLNAALRQVRKQRGELGPDHRFTTALGELDFAVGDRIQFSATDKPAGIINDGAGRIERIEGALMTVRSKGPDGAAISVDTASFNQFRHGYAGTIHRGQGRTFDETYLACTKHWRATSAYVALTRHRDRTALFVARPVAQSVAQLARQIARTDERRAASVFHPAQDTWPAPDFAALENWGRFDKRRFRRGPDRQPGSDDVGWHEEKYAREKPRRRQDKELHDQARDTGHACSAFHHGAAFKTLAREHVFDLGGDPISRSHDTCDKAASGQPRTEAPPSTPPLAVCRDAAAVSESLAVIRSAIRGAFRAAAKTLARRMEEEPKPGKPARRGGKTGGVRAWRMHDPTRRFISGRGATVWGRYTALREGKSAAPKVTPGRHNTEAMFSDCVMPADGVDWIGLWANNADIAGGFEDDFTTQSNHLSPHP